jgi:hypothetical protein
VLAIDWARGYRPVLLGEILGILESPADFTARLSWLEWDLDEFGEDLDRHLDESSNDMKRFFPGGF